VLAGTDTFRIETPSDAGMAVPKATSGLALDGVQGAGNVAVAFAIVGAQNT
jgi:hypothetical protein